MATVRFTFEPLARSHLEMLKGWLSNPHVAAWWGAPPNSERVAAEYGPMIDGTDPARGYIASLEGRQLGYLQAYRWADQGEEAAEIDARPGEVGIDYLIGEESLIGRRLGPAMLRQFLAELVFADPGVTAVRTVVAVANRRSWRCLEGIGFERLPARAVRGEDGPQFVLVLRRRELSR